tara:strand:+ start:285 stop:524 length:240 start_codon:yes stop_codon:yes gene_type:complete
MYEGAELLSKAEFVVVAVISISSVLDFRLDKKFNNLCSRIAVTESVEELKVMWFFGKILGSFLNLMMVSTQASNFEEWG